MKIVPKPLGDAGLYDTSFPWRAVLHTTEGHNLPTYNGTNPHATLDLEHEIMYVHCDWHHAAKALLHPAGTIETNHARAVQFELIGFAAQTGHWPARYYRFIHRALIHAQHQGCDFQMHTANPWNQPRFTSSKWKRFHGICGHMHVPNNNHTDPGTEFHSKLIL